MNIYIKRIARHLYTEQRHIAQIYERITVLIIQTEQQSLVDDAYYAAVRFGKRQTAAGNFEHELSIFRCRAETEEQLEVYGKSKIVRKSPYYTRLVQALYIEIEFLEQTVDERADIIRASRDEYIERSLESDYGKYSFHKLLNAYAVNLAERRNLGRYGIIGIFTELNQDTALFHCLDGFLPAVIAGSKRKIDYRGIYAVEYRAYSVTQFLSQQPRISGRIYAVACSVAAYGHISAMHLYGIYLVLTRYIGNIYFIVIGILYCIPTELY